MVNCTLPLFKPRNRSDKGDLCTRTDLCLAISSSQGQPGVVLFINALTVHISCAEEEYQKRPLCLPVVWAFYLR